MIRYLIKIFSFIPTTISNVIYLFIFNINRPLLFCIAREFWYRNSLFFKKTSLGLSDIDLTFYFDKKPTAQRIKDLFFIRNILKFTMGRLGEFVLYTKDDLVYFSQFINAFERKRDPFFEIAVSPSKAETYLFLMKTYQSDKANLNNYENLRINKWSYIFDLLGIKLELNPHNLSDTIEKKLKNHHNEYIDENHIIFKKDLWIKYQELSFDTNWQKELVFEQVRWEIWGLYTQRYLILNKQQLRDHSRNLKNICNQHLAQLKGTDLLIEAISCLELSF